MDKVQTVFLHRHHAPLIFLVDKIIIARIQVLEILQLYGLLIVATSLLDVTHQMRHRGPEIDHVRHYAGGFQKTADKNSVTVTFPNNQSESTKRGFLWIRNYPEVEPGGVITMRFDEEKREKLEKPKEKIDWGNELRTSLSTLTSVISLIILVDRLK